MKSVWQNKKSPIHVCFVSPESYPLLVDRDFQSAGGAEVQQVLIGKALVQRGLRVTFVVNDYGQAERETSNGIQVIRGPFSYLGGSNWNFPVETLRLIKILNRVGADIYILKDPLALLFTMSWHRRLSGGKLVKIISHDHDCQKLVYNVPYILYWLGTRRIDYTIFQSEYQKRMCWVNLGLRGQVIKNIVNDNTTAALPNESRDITALWVGSALERKRPHLFLDVAKRLPEVHFTMIIAPGLSADFNRSVKERARSIRNVTYLGFVEHSKIRKYYDRAKLLVNTSEAEGFPNIFLEAWRSGVPVVSLEIDPDQVIVNNELGRVSGDVETYMKDIRELLNKEGLRRRLGNNGIQYVKKNHGKETIVRQFMALFENLLTDCH